MDVESRIAGNSGGMASGSPGGWRDWIYRGFSAS